MRKLFVLLAALLLAAPVSDAFALRPKNQAPAEQPADENVDFDIKEEGSPKRANAGGNVVETQKSVEVPAPEPQSQLTPNQLKMLTDILAATEIENAQLKLEGVQLQRAEQQNRFNELTQPKPVISAEEVAKQAEPDIEALKMARAFPMPGGNPQVVSILGGNKKALEATLVFPNGLRYEVHKGMILEGGYRVASVSNNGVTLEKNGFKLPMPLSSGNVKETGNKPWDRGQEMGTPVGDSTTTAQ